MLVSRNATRRFCSLAAAVLCVGLSMGDVQAARLLVETNGFEGFNAASLVGQQGWTQFGSGSTAVVQAGSGIGGSQAVAVTKAPNADTRFAKPVTAFTPQRFIIIDWDMRVAPSGAATGVFGPLMGVEAYDASSGVGVLGTLGVDASTGDILYQSNVGGQLAETGVKASFNAWNNFRLVLDYANNRYSAFFNNNHLITSPFVDGAQLDKFTDADLSAIAAGATQGDQEATSTAHIDNFRVWDGLPGDFNNDGRVNGTDLPIWKGAVGGTGADADGDNDTDGADLLVWQRQYGTSILPPPGIGAVPEPSTLGLASLGALALWRRRR